MSGFRCTPKQIQLLRTIVEGNPDGTFCDLDQILDNLTYETTKQSLQFSIRALIAHGLIEKRPIEPRPRPNIPTYKRRPIAPTTAAYEMFGRQPPSGINPPPPKPPPKPVRPAPSVSTAALLRESHNLDQEIADLARNTEELLGNPDALVVFNKE